MKDALMFRTSTWVWKVQLPSSNGSLVWHLALPKKYPEISPQNMQWWYDDIKGYIGNMFMMFMMYIFKYMWQHPHIVQTVTVTKMRWKYTIWRGVLLYMMFFVEWYRYFLSGTVMTSLSPLQWWFHQILWGHVIGVLNSSWWSQSCQKIPMMRSHVKMWSVVVVVVVDDDDDDDDENIGYRSVKIWGNASTSQIQLASAHDALDSSVKGLWENESGNWMWNQRWNRVPFIFVKKETGFHDNGKATLNAAHPFQMCEVLSWHAKFRWVWGLAARRWITQVGYLMGALDHQVPSRLQKRVPRRSLCKPKFAAP